MQDLKTSYAPFSPSQGQSLAVIFFYVPYSGRDCLVDWPRLSYMCHIEETSAERAEALALLAAAVEPDFPQNDQCPGPFPRLRRFPRFMPPNLDR